MSSAVEPRYQDVLNYIRSQAAQKTIDQLIERVQLGVDGLHAAANAIPESLLDVDADDGWTARQCLHHAVASNLQNARQILYVAHTGELPGPENADVPEARGEALAAHQEGLESLYEHARAADPDAFLDTTWRHQFFGDLNWREWLIFLRVHCLDHTGQLNAMRERLG